MGPKTEQIWVGPFLNALDRILAVVENHPRVGVIDAVVDVIAHLAVAHRLADDLRHRVAGAGHQEASRLGQNLDVAGKQAVELGIDDLRQFAERLHRRVVRRGKTAADVDQVHFRVAAVPGLLEHRRGQAERLDIVLEIGRLAADVKTDALDDEARLGRREDEVHGLARRGAEFGGQLDHGPGIRHLEAQRQSGIGGVLLDLSDFLPVVEGDQRLVLVQLLQRFGGLGRVGVDDLVPDPILPRPGGQVLDVLVDDHELRHRGDVEASALLVERAHDGGIGVRLDRVIDLHAGQVTPELAVVFPQRGVVDHEERRAVLLRQFLQSGRRDHSISFGWGFILTLAGRRRAPRGQLQLPSLTRKFLNCQGSFQSRSGRL